MDELDFFGTIPIMGNSESHKIVVNINKEYYREKFEKVINDWLHTPNLLDEEELLNKLMECFEDEK